MPVPIVGKVIQNVLTSPNVPDNNGEASNIVDVVHNLACGVCRVAEAITANASPGPDALGGSVSSLTEAVMGVTGGLCEIAEAIDKLADAVNAGHG